MNQEKFDAAGVCPTADQRFRNVLSFAAYFSKSKKCTTNRIHALKHKVFE
jgi:hypothetical protein